MNKFLKSGFLLTLGNLLVQGLSFITLPIYTRVIAREVLGQFNLYMSWVSMVSIFIGMQLSGSLAVGKIKYKTFEEYAVNVLTLSNLVFLGLFFLAYWCKAALAPWMEWKESYILILFLNSYASYLVGFAYNYFIQLQETIKTFCISVATAISSVGLSLFLLYYMEDDFTALVLGKGIPFLLAALVVLGYFYRKKQIHYKKEYWMFAFGVSFPLLFHHLGHNVLNQFDRIMIGRMLGLKEVALYSFGYNVGLVIQLVFSSLNAAWCPHFFQLKNDNSSELGRAIRLYLRVAVFCILGYLTVFPELSLLLGGENYMESIKFISFIVISYFFVFLYSFPVNIQFYHGNTKFIPVGTLFAGGCNILLNLILIPRYQIYGAVMATVCSYLALLIVHHIISRKLYQYQEVGAATYVRWIGVVLGYALLMNCFLDVFWVRWIVGGVVAGVSVYRYKKDLLSFLKTYKKIS